MTDAPPTSITVPNYLVYIEDFISADECEQLVTVLQEARSAQALETHSGSSGNTLSYQKIWDLDHPVLTTINVIRERTRPEIQTLLQSEALPYLTYTDLVYRPVGASMGWHNDTDWYKERAATAILALNTLRFIDGGESAVHFPGTNYRLAIPHVARRFVAFPSGFQHCVQDLHADRYALVLWYTLDPDYAEQTLTNEPDPSAVVDVGQT